MQSLMLVNTIKWTARVLGTLVFLLISVIFVGEFSSIPNLSEQSLSVTIQFAAIFLMWAGLILAWKWEGVGGFMIVGGFMLFWIVEQRIPRLNIAFLPLIISGILYLVYWLYSIRASKKVNI